jgi:nucleoside diphosphate kinase
MENCTKELMKKYENIEKIIEKIKEKGVELTTYHMRAAKKELFEYYLKLAENENFSKEVLNSYLK